MAHHHWHPELTMVDDEEVEQYLLGEATDANLAELQFVGHCEDLDVGDMEEYVPVTPPSDRTVAVFYDAAGTKQGGQAVVVKPNAEALQDEKTKESERYRYRSALCVQTVSNWAVTNVKGFTPRPNAHDVQDFLTISPWRTSLTKAATAMKVELEGQFEKLARLYSAALSILEVKVGATTIPLCHTYKQTRFIGKKRVRPVEGKEKEE